MPKRKSSGSHFGAPGFVHARRAAGEDQALGREFADALGRDVVPDDLAVDVVLAHAAGDQLGVLRAEVENQHLFIGDPAALAGASFHASHSDARAKNKKARPVRTSETTNYKCCGPRLLGACRFAPIAMHRPPV